MAQRSQAIQGQSIDSTVRDSSPLPEAGNSRRNVEDEGIDGRTILPDVERSASPSTSTWSSAEIPENPFSTAQSTTSANQQRTDSIIASSESDSLSRGRETPRSQSNQSGHVRWPHQGRTSSSNQEYGTTLPEQQLQEDFETLTERQDNVPTHRRDDRPRMPSADELRGLPLTTRMIAPKGKDSPENIIVVLHDRSGNEHFLQEFAENNLRPKNTACLLLRGVSAIPGKNDSYQWEDNVDAFFKCSKLILVDVISALLIGKCNFPARKIILFGHGEGAMAALRMFSTWATIEFGGIICVGGELPSYVAPSNDMKSNTAILLLGGSLGMMTPIAQHQIRQHFSYIDCDLLEDKDDALPRGRQLRSVRDFFSHRLHEEEWMKPAVITFDGGGMKGYGSLFILQALMNKIGAEERRLDDCTESSFYPCMYKPKRKPQRQGHTNNDSSEDLETKESNLAVASSMAGIPDSSLFLPCHYFQYAGGTSTGGLISIMISRFRMTVDECLDEYRTLGSDVFGKPRLFTMKTLLRNKFDEQRLHKAIEDATFRHCEDPGAMTWFPSPKDVCRTTVVAFTDRGASHVPYLIRTFETFAPAIGVIRRTSSAKVLEIRNAGPAQQMDIPTVGRATTAAPGYFRHLTTQIGDTTLRFKDGGFGCNNPSWEIYTDIKALLANGSRDMGPFISIGTGVSDIRPFPKKQGHLRHRWAEFRAATKGLPTMTKGAHDAMMHAAYSDGREKFQYSRFDAGEELGAIAMDEWKPSDRTGRAFFSGKHKHSGRETLNKIENAMRRYLANKEVDDELNKCAKVLVQRRRLQIRDQSKWDRFASASSYICPYKKCPERRHDTLELYRGHVRRYHPHDISQKDLMVESKYARRCWLYRDNNNNDRTTDPTGVRAITDDGPEAQRIHSAPNL